MLQCIIDFLIWWQSPTWFCITMTHWIYQQKHWRAEKKAICPCRQLVAAEREAKDQERSENGKKNLTHRGKQGGWGCFKILMRSANLTKFLRKVCCFFLKIRICKKYHIASIRHGLQSSIRLSKHQHHKFIALPHEWPPLSPAFCSIDFHSFVMLQSYFWFKFPLLLKT